IRAAFRGTAPRTAPVLDRRNLRQLVGEVERGVDRMVRWDLDDLVLWQYAADIPRTLTPGAGTPEVVHPQHSPLQEVLAELDDLHFVQSDGSHVGREKEGALEECRVRTANDGVSGSLVIESRDVGEGQFRESDHQVLVRHRIVRIPAVAATLPAERGIRQPTEGEAGTLGGHHPWLDPRAEAVIAELSAQVDGHEDRRDAEQQEEEWIAEA